jgi:hypothetical protein
MNERIQELVKQATTEESDGFKYFDKEKFAELIVRECAELVADDDNAFDVLKHFGVES